MRIGVALALIPFAGAAAQAQTAPASEAAAREVVALADAFVAARLAADPDLGHRFGVALPPQLEGRLLDRTPEGLGSFHATIDELTGRLERIEPRGLDREKRALHAILSEELAVHAGLRQCRREYWDVSSFGWLGDILEMPQIEPVGTPATRAATIRRWGTLPASVDTQISNLQRGLANGYSAPKAIVEQSIAQLDAVIASPFEKSPFYSPALRDPDPAFARELRALTVGSSQQALGRYRAFLADTYLPRSRATLGLNGLPNGAACYEAMARRYTSLAEPVEQLFARMDAANLQGVAEAVQAGAETYGTGEPATLLQKARSDPAERYASPEEMLADARETAARARDAFRPLFLVVPAQQLSVQAYPAGRRGLGLPPRYFPSGDPQVPAVTWVPDERFGAMPRAVLRTTTLHEGVPGHHMVAARMAGRSSHPLMKIAYQAAFDEGWAQYSERLADEAGMARSPAGRVIMGLNRGKAALIDIGMHRRGWDKEQLAAYFAERGGLGQQVDERLTRTAAFPAQQLSYGAGELTILDLRAQAERRLGSKFSLAAFHEEVLRDGWVPLWFLRENVEAWIAALEANPAG